MTQATRGPRADVSEHGKTAATIPWRRIPVDRDSLLTGAALFGITAAAWVGVVAGSGATHASGIGTRLGVDAPAAVMDGPLAIAGVGLDLAQMLAFVAAWLVMMAAMMLPSAAPLVLLYREGGPGGVAANTAPLVAGYLLAWGAFGVLVFCAQQALEVAADTDPMIAGALQYGVVAVLVLAGLYQFTPLKDVCLRQCRSPLDFLMQHWRGGITGALRLGLKHGLYCLGCCWGLMAVLVAAGGMGLAWVALIALIVFVEKVLPFGEQAARATGVLLWALAAAIAVWPELGLPLRAGGMGI